MSQSAPIDAPSKTYMEVIKSRAVAEKIVEALQLHVEDEVESETFFAKLKDTLKTWVKNTVRTLQHYARYGREIPASPFARAVEDVEENLSVSIRKNTYAFDITYRSGNPEKAAAVANMAAEIFLTHSAEAYRNESTRAREFIERQLQESRKALETARAEILAYKNAGNTFLLDSEYDETLKSVKDLENTLIKTEAKLARLRQTYAATNPNVVAEEAEKAELERQIAALWAQLAEYPEKEKRLNELTLAEELAVKNYEFFLKQYEEARVKESVTLNEIRIISRATPPLYPVKPLKIMYAGLSFAVALVVAVGWALFFEYLNPRVRTIRDVDDEVGLPVLGVIPTLKHSRLKVRT